MRKKIKITVLVLISILGAFAGGFYAGLKFFSTVYSTSDIVSAYVDLIPLQLQMEQLDRGDYGKLRESLNLQIDGEVLRIFSHLDKAKNKEDIRKATGWLQRVAKHRSDHPPTYPQEISTEEHQKVTEQVSKILNWAMSENGNLTSVSTGR